MYPQGLQRRVLGRQFPARHAEVEHEVPKLHLQLNGKSLKTCHFRVRTPIKLAKSDPFGSTRLSLPV